MQSVSLLLLLALTAVANTKKYTEDVIKTFGPNCFDAFYQRSNPSEVFPADDPEDFLYSQVIKFAINPGYGCWFETHSNVMLEGDEHVKIYYLPYKGYAPAMRVGKGTCKLEPEDYLLQGSLKAWFRPNAFGGPCAYIIYIGVHRSHNGSGVVTMTREHEF